MGKTYGRQIALQTLLFLSNTDATHIRIRKAFSEIGVITVEDTTPELFAKIVSWREKYLITDLANLPNEMEIIESEIKVQVESLIIELVYLCSDIITENGK